MFIPTFVLLASVTAMLLVPFFALAFMGWAFRESASRGGDLHYHYYYEVFDDDDDDDFDQHAPGITHPPDDYHYVE